VADVPAVLLLVNRLPGNRGTYESVAPGSAVAGLVWLIPVVSGIVPLLVLPMGAGAWTLGDDDQKQRTKPRRHFA
jgi:uncharacterized membrane protein